MKPFRTLQSLLRAREGIAYVEFAICIPFILMLLLGAVEMTRYIIINQKVEKAAVTLSDVVAQANTVTTSDLDKIVEAAEQVMEPYTFGANGYVIISSVSQTGAPTVSNPPRVSWQYVGGGSWTHASAIGTTGNPATLPDGFSLVDKDNIIIAEVFYNYQPILATNGITTGGAIYKMGLYKPRLGALSTLGALQSSPLWFAALIQKGAFL